MRGGQKTSTLTNRRQAGRNKQLNKQQTDRRETKQPNKIKKTHTGGQDNQANIQTNKQPTNIQPINQQINNQTNKNKQICPSKVLRESNKPQQTNHVTTTLIRKKTTIELHYL